MVETHCESHIPFPVPSAVDELRSVPADSSTMGPVPDRSRLLHHKRVAEEDPEVPGKEHAHEEHHQRLKLLLRLAE